MTIQKHSKSCKHGILMQYLILMVDLQEKQESRNIFSLSLILVITCSSDVNNFIAKLNEFNNEVQLN